MNFILFQSVSEVIGSSLQLREGTFREQGNGGKQVKMYSQGWRSGRIGVAEKKRIVLQAELMNQNSILLFFFKILFLADSKFFYYFPWKV